MGPFFSTFCLQSLEKLSLEVRLLFQNLYFLWKTSFTHSVTFQSNYLTSPRWRWCIYLSLNQMSSIGQGCHSLKEPFVTAFGQNTGYWLTLSVSWEPSGVCKQGTWNFLSLFSFVCFCIHSVLPVVKSYIYFVLLCSI